MYGNTVVNDHAIDDMHTIYNVHAVYNVQAVGHAHTIDNADTVNDMQAIAYAHTVDHIHAVDDTGAVYHTHAVGFANHDRIVDNHGIVDNDLAFNYVNRIVGIFATGGKKKDGRHRK